MSALPKGFSLAALLSVTVLAGCADSQPVPYTGVSSSSHMKPDLKDETGHIPYSYSVPTDWKKYSQMMMDPVVVYQGHDAQFDDVSPADQRILANGLQQKFEDALSKRFRTTDTPAPGTLRVHLTLTGAETTTPVLGTFSRFDLMGGPYNLVQTARGKKGSFTGSVSYAVEIYDASTRQLLKAYVSKQYPSPMNISASWGSLSAAQAGLDNGAEQLAEQLQ
ncbi:DUF3313 domain-containing protein [Ewingella americana]